MINVLNWIDGHVELDNRTGQWRMVWGECLAGYPLDLVLSQISGRIKQEHDDGK